MNINQGILCDVCNSSINFRYQIGFINYIKFKFCCPECGCPIYMEIKFKSSDNMSPPQITPSIKNATFTTENIQNMKFSIQASSEHITTKNLINPYNNPSHNFNDIMSPFIQSKIILGGDNLIKFKEHCLRGLSAKKNLNIYERLNSLFFSKSNHFVPEINKQLSSLNLSDIIVKNNELSMLEGIYNFNIRYFNNFLCEGEFTKINNIILENIKIIKEKNITEFNNLIAKFNENNLLNIYEKRILRTINNYIDHFEELIPAMSLKYVKDINNLSNIFENFTTRTITFNDIKNIYLEVYENLLEIYDLIIALNNIFYRNNFNSMCERPTSLSFLRSNNVEYLDDFENLNKGCKIHYLRNNEIFNNLMPNLNNKIRNVIGHEDWEYDEYNQKIKYGNNTQEKYLLEYAYECYSMFLNCVAIYKLIVDIKYNNLIK